VLAGIRGGCGLRPRQKCPSGALPSPYAPLSGIHFKLLNKLISRQITEQTNAVPCPLGLNEVHSGEEGAGIRA
jgi:hypothetical protein